jgi:hypothetical protein
MWWGDAEKFPLLNMVSESAAVEEAAAAAPPVRL